MNDYSADQEKFIASAKRLAKEREIRKSVANELLPTGIPYIDKVIGGILPTDLILIGAKTGAGKSELAVTIAKNIAKLGKRCHLFALEYEEGEVERRIKYQHISRLYKKDSGKRHINYQDWYFGKYDFLEKYEDDADKELSQYNNLNTFYRDTKFDLLKFQRMFRSLNGQTECVIVDLLQFFDFDGENENKAITDIVKAIKDMSQLQRTSVILISHLRKINKGEKSIVPAIEDFHGTSNIAKIATRIILMAPGGLEPDTGKPITYVHVAKNRYAGERTRVLARMTFDPILNAYDEKFQLGILSDDEKKFIPFEYEEQRPNWLR